MKLVSRSDLARIKGVSPAAVTIACRHALAAACVDDRVDLDHPAAAEYLLKGKAAPKKKAPPPKPKRQPKPRKPPGKPGRKRRTSTTVETEQSDAPQLDELGFSPEILDLTAREIAERYGTSRNYVDWLDAYQKQQRARDLWLKNEQTEGRLIDRELVTHHVFGAIDSTNKRLLTDATKTIAVRAQAMSNGNASLEEIEKAVREIIAKQLKAVQATTVRVLRNA